MPERSKYSGLCETCEHDATCMLRRSSQLKIIQCEEFSIQPVTGKTSRALPETMPVVEESRLGLCANCLHVANCGFPNARQGVLQCEEYVVDEEGVVPPVREKTERSQSAA